MRMGFVVLAAVAAMGLTACGESKADKTAEVQSDAIKEGAEIKADGLENKADAVEAQGGPGAEAQADALDRQADAVEQAGDAKADAVEAAAGKKD